MKKSVRRVMFLLCFLLLLGTVTFLTNAAFSQETLTITTYYPAPFGVYTNLRLFPSAQPACTVNDEGTMYYSNAAGNQQLMICGRDSSGNLVWQGVGLWTRNGNNLFPSDANLSVGIGTNNPLAALDVTSTASGFLPPRMSSGQRNGIANPTNGMIIYNTTTKALEIYSQGSWSTLGGQFGGAYSCYLCYLLDLYDSLGIDTSIYYVANPYTHDRSCPAGYQPQHLMPAVIGGMGVSVFDVIVCWK